jgi:hypothetical protein
METAAKYTHIDINVGDTWAPLNAKGPLPRQITEEVDKFTVKYVTFGGNAQHKQNSTGNVISKKSLREWIRDHKAVRSNTVEVQQPALDMQKLMKKPLSASDIHYLETAQSKRNRRNLQRLEQFRRSERAA